MQVLTLELLNHWFAAHACAQVRAKLSRALQAKTKVDFAQIHGLGLQNPMHSNKHLRQRPMEVLYILADKRCSAGL